MNKKSHIMLRACSRCQGDLFPDLFEEDFACLQCGRRVSAAQLLASREPAALAASKTLSVAA